MRRTLVYLDDIVIYSKSWEEHLQHLHLVFQRLHDTGLRIKPQKSKVEFKELDYLGYTVGDGRLRPHKRKVVAIANTT